MKKYFLLPAIFVLFCNISFAQTNAQDAEAVQKNFNSKVGNPVDTLQGWHKGGVVNFSLTQGSLQNWAAGGDDFSLSLDGFANLFANYRKGKNEWDNNLLMSYGMLKTTSLGMRKTDDNFDLTSKYGYQLSSKWYMGALFDFRTQFANGYLYPDDSTIVSRAFAPAYASLAFGFNYQPANYFSLFLSPVNSRFVIVADPALAREGAYGVDTGKEMVYQLGAYASAQFNKEIMKNISWTTRLDLFSNYLKNPQNIKVYWTSLISLKVNTLITVSLNTELIYDDDIRVWQNSEGVYGPRTQFKEVLGIGFTYKW
jgi:Protein of unknown function (DUF3078)